MQTIIYLISAGALLAFAYVVFHQVVAKDYLTQGRLGWRASTLQLLVFVLFFCFPFQYMPSNWAWDWLPNGTLNRSIALFLVLLGMILAFGTMAIFGIRRAFGIEVKGIVNTGLYRYTRNPQMLGGWLMVLGVFAYQPSLQNLGWILIWAVIGHWMIAVEEQHLDQLFGEAYRHYCQEPPRYVFQGNRKSR